MDAPAEISFGHLVGLIVLYILSTDSLYFLLYFYKLTIYTVYMYTVYSMYTVYN